MVVRLGARIYIAFALLILIGGFFFNSLDCYILDNIDDFGEKSFPWKRVT